MRTRTASRLPTGINLNPLLASALRSDKGHPDAANFPINTRYLLPNRARSGSETDSAGTKQSWSARKRTYLRRQQERAAIQKPITPHNLRHTYTIYLLNVSAERVDIQTLRGHATLTTTPIYTNVGQERMEKVVGRL